MGLLDNLKKALDGIKESRKPELPIREDILEREKGFEWDKSRKDWLVNNTYLSEGGLDELKKHPSYHEPGANIRLTYYSSLRGMKYPSRKVRVFVPIETTEDAARLLAERNLKLSLHHRGCNAGVFYRSYKEGENIIVEATPATITCE